MNNLRFLWIASLGVLLFVACHKDPQPPICDDCDQTTLVSSTLYENAPNDFFTFDTVFIDGNCLEITFTSSGCDGSSWVIQLIDSEQILESFPVQRVLRMSLQNEELCDAVFSRTVTFDLTPLQLAAYDRILLNIDGWEGSPLLYEY